MSMSKLLMAVLLGLGLAVPARAEVVDTGPNGFSIAEHAEINATAPAVFRLVSEQIGSWWDPAHSFSGSAANMTIEPRAGGCFCERLPNGSVQHMIVTRIDRPRALVLQGSLGPLSTMAVAGAMQWAFEEKSGHTDVSVVYNVGGYAPAGFTQIAAAVDRVMSVQVKRLKAMAETGRPE